MSGSRFFAGTLMILCVCLRMQGSDARAKHVARKDSPIQKNDSMRNQHHDEKLDDHMMYGMYGRYPMSRESSGTSWVPDSSPLEGFHLAYKNWVLMLHGFSYLVMDIQRGKRGGKKVFDENMFMLMAQKDFDQSSFALRGMVSAEPVTVGKCGYPLLLQIGETCDGRTPLVDRQHPHDLFGELAFVSTYIPTPSTSFFLYVALPGEPALGPPTYFMRFSSEYIPATPLGHHWMDSTHISFGVITGGMVYKGLKIEVSAFNGREPDQERFDIEKPKIDSHSLRVSFNPNKDLSFQVSYGLLKSPEQLHPEVSVKRCTFSVLCNKSFQNSNVQMAAIVGINKNEPGNTLPAFLIEGTAEFHHKHIAFSRLEWLKNDDLFTEESPFAEETFLVKKLTLGYIYEFLTANHLKWGIGGLIDFPMVPNKIKNCYGDTISYMAFLQIKLV